MHTANCLVWIEGLETCSPTSIICSAQAVLLLPCLVVLAGMLRVSAHLTRKHGPAPAGSRTEAAGMQQKVCSHLAARTVAKPKILRLIKFVRVVECAQ